MVHRGIARGPDRPEAARAWVRCSRDADRAAAIAVATVPAEHGAMPSEPQPEPAASLPVTTVSIAAEGFCYGPLVDRLAPSELAGSGRAQRWSDAGAPTIYLASDAGVALAEWGRHVPLDERREPSALWRVPVTLPRVVDLRVVADEALEALGAAAGIPSIGAADDPAWCLDADRARDLGAWLRYAGGLDGLIVPSVAFLDDRSRGNIVVFLDDGRRAERVLGEPQMIAAVHWTDDGPVTGRIDTRVQLATAPALGRL